MNDDSGDYFKVKEINSEVILEYDPNYPPLMNGQKIIRRHNS